MEAQILEIIRDKFDSAYPTKLSVKEITDWFVDRHGEEYDRKVTPKCIGGIVRKNLQFRPQKSHGVFMIPLSEKPRLERIFEKSALTRWMSPRQRRQRLRCQFNDWIVQKK